MPGRCREILSGYYITKLGATNRPMDRQILLKSRLHMTNKPCRATRCAPQHLYNRCFPNWDEERVKLWRSYFAPGIQAIRKHKQLRVALGTRGRGRGRNAVPFLPWNATHALNCPISPESVSGHVAADKNHRFRNQKCRCRANTLLPDVSRFPSVIFEKGRFSTHWKRGFFL